MLEMLEAFFVGAKKNALKMLKTKEVVRNGGWLFPSRQMHESQK